MVLIHNFVFKPDIGQSWIEVKQSISTDRFLKKSGNPTVYLSDIRNSLGMVDPKLGGMADCLDS